MRSTFFVSMVLAVLGLSATAAPVKRCSDSGLSVLSGGVLSDNGNGNTADGNGSNDGNGSGSGNASGNDGNSAGDGSGSGNASGNSAWGNGANGNGSGDDGNTVGSIIDGITQPKQW